MQRVRGSVDTNAPLDTKILKLLLEGEQDMILKSQSKYVPYVAMLEMIASLQICILPSQSRPAFS